MNEINAGAAFEKASASRTTRTGAQILVDNLRIHGVRRAFCVPGESYLAVLDALSDVKDEVELVVCRHEAGAANMAEAHGKLTGEPGICFVTRGPGATHASTGVHTAFQDSTPMILFVGQVARGHNGREAFQEIDYRAMFGSLAKWVVEIEDPARVPEFVARAFQTAVSGRPGPVVIALPEDMLTEATVAPPRIGRYSRVEAAPQPDAMTELGRMLAAAERPLAMLGGGGWTEAACEGVRAFAEAFGLPVTASFRSQRLFDNRHPLYAGHVGVGIDSALAARVRAADLLVAIGPRLGEATTGGYDLLEAPRPAQRLVHVHPGAEELGSVYQADLMVNSGMASFAEALRALAPPPACAWAGWAEAAHADYLAFIAPPARPHLQGVDMGEVMRHIRETLPEGATLCNGAGNYATWVHRFYPYPDLLSQLAPTSGAMGYGLPAAVAAALECPDRRVLCFGGDGCFLMSAHELATAVRYRLPIISIVVNNGAYGTIRMHQEMRYPDRMHGTDLVNPDFVALAHAYGAQGERVTETAQFPGAFARALACAGPSLIEVVTDIAAITPQKSLDAIRGIKARA